MHRSEATKRWICRSASVVLGVSLAVTVPLLYADRPQDRPPTADVGRTEELGSSISFEPNLGQADDQVKFMARGPGYTLSLTQHGAVFSFEQPEFRAGAESFNSLTVKFVGANAVPKLAAKDKLTTTSSYFLGADPKKWRTGIPNYARVTIENIYPGIDVVYRGTHGRLQCHFLIAPGAKPDRITLGIAGANNPRLDAEGNLILRSGKTELRLYKPNAYQDLGAKRATVSARYLLSRGQIKFTVADYDRTKLLVIGPVLGYAAYLTTADATLNPPHPSRTMKVSRENP
jgi:hypothetical protein